MSSTELKRQKEKQVVSLMIHIYCRKKHGNKNTLCKQCQQLLDHAVKRADSCPFMETKTFCSNCKVHCYRSDMRLKIKEVMSFSGPRMIFHHPFMALSHVTESIKEKNEWRNKMTIKKILWIILGCFGVAMGAVGAALPMIPAFPFLLLAAYSFAKSSEKLHSWFINTKLYKDNLEDYVAGRGMTRETKIRLMVTVTLLMSFGFFMMFRKNLFIPCAILGGVWLFHIVYFALGVKTLKRSEVE